MSDYDVMLARAKSAVKNLQKMTETNKKRENDMCQQAYKLLRRNEKKLSGYCDVISTNVDELDQTKKILEVCVWDSRGDFPENPRFYHAIFSF